MRGESDNAEPVSWLLINDSSFSVVEVFGNIVSLSVAICLRFSNISICLCCTTCGISSVQYSEGMPSDSGCGHLQNSTEFLGVLQVPDTHRAPSFTRNLSLSPQQRFLGVWPAAQHVQMLGLARICRRCHLDTMRACKWHRLSRWYIAYCGYRTDIQSTTKYRS